MSLNCLVVCICLGNNAWLLGKRYRKMTAYIKAQLFFLFQRKRKNERWAYSPLCTPLEITCLVVRGSLASTWLQPSWGFISPSVFHFPLVFQKACSGDVPLFLMFVIVGLYHFDSFNIILMVIKGQEIKVLLLN